MAPHIPKVGGWKEGRLFCPRVAGWGQDGGGVVLWGPPQEGPWCPHPLWPTPQRTLVSLYPTLRKIKVSLSAVPP